MKKSLLVLIMSATFVFAKGMYQGEVMETMNSAGYTYMKISAGGKSYWIASGEISIKKGEKIAYSQEMMMQDFHSKTLNRTFDSIMFVTEVRKAEQEVLAQDKPQNSFDTVKVSPYKQEGTLSVQEVFSQAKALAGKTIKVRGKVTKVSEMIMQKNWIHIQDGTGDMKSNDLVVTSQIQSAKVGDIVTAEGVVITDKNLGAGYFYPVLLEQGIFRK